MESLKLVLVGDGSVGKTCLLNVYTTGHFPVDYVPTVVDNCTQTVAVDGRSVRLCLWDTAGQEDYDRLRPLSYSGTNVFLVCFSVDGRNSFKNVLDKWSPELRHYLPDAPLLLVGTKIDLRTDRNRVDDLARQKDTMVTREEGERLATQIGAKKYVECSALQQQGLSSVFEEAVRVQFAAHGQGKKKQKSNKKNCSLL